MCINLDITSAMEHDASLARIEYEELTDLAILADASPGA